MLLFHFETHDLTSGLHNGEHIAPLKSPLYKYQSCINPICFIAHGFIFIFKMWLENWGFAHAELELINSSTKEEINEFDFLLAPHSFSHISEY